MNIRAVIFDFDGLILDTESAEFGAVTAVYHEEGATLPLAEWAKGIGTLGGFDPFAYLCSQIGRQLDEQEFRQRWRAQYSERMQTIAPRPGVSDYLQNAQSLGLAIGLASSSPRSWVEGYLQELGLRTFFSCVKTADDVLQVKPDPALYVAACADLGVSPDEAVAFEDSPNGALAALRAGLYCIAVPNVLTAGLEFPHVHQRIASMDEIPLPSLLAKLR